MTDATRERDESAQIARARILGYLKRQRLITVDPDAEVLTVSDELAERAPTLAQLHVTIEDMISEDDKVVCRNAWRATDALSGKLISLKGIVIWRFANDKIVERWASVEPPR